VIDRFAERFEDRVGGVDLVIDLVGGETLDRSWGLLAPDGAIVSTAAPDAAQRAPAGRRGVWFMMKPDAAQLGRIAAAVVAGRLKSTIADVTGRAGLADAIERNKQGHAPGKLVFDLTEGYPS
jgi:NADPH:quinone reductase-like Zn-dependent oxidoreductase